MPGIIKKVLHFISGIIVFVSFILSWNYIKSSPYYKKTEYKIITVDSSFVVIQKREAGIIQNLLYMKKP